MGESIAVLSSGGLDSCALLIDMAMQGKVHPIYVQNGFIWEKAELKALDAFLQALHNPNIQPITALSLPMGPLYGDHWSLTGRGIPREDDPDSKTYLPGRNVVLLSVAAVWCGVHHVPRIAIGTLFNNPFADATMDFFEQFGSTLSAGLGFQIRIEAPFRQSRKKEDLLRTHQNLPLGLSLSCMAPQEGRHCGHCNKCHERQVAYKRAGMVDPTVYAKREEPWN